MKAPTRQLGFIVLSLLALAWSPQAQAAAPVAKLEITRQGATQPEQPIATRVVAWGDNRSGQTSVPAGLSGVVAIAAGGAHTVALQQDGSVVAWGDNLSGQTNVPLGLRSVVAIAAGGYHTVALKQDGSVVAWGYNYYGQTNVPAGLSGVVAIAAGGGHTVALKQDGSVVAWGDDFSVPAGLSGVVAIAAGGGHTVALKQDGSVVAWGWDYFGQTNVPAGLSGIVAIAAGGDHTVALKQDGRVVAWGYNQHGQTSVPAGLSGVMAIAAGRYHTVALKQDGSVVAWGGNYLGQTRIPASLSGVVAIAAGSTHTVVLAGPQPLDFGTVSQGQPAVERSFTLGSGAGLDVTGLSAQIIGPQSGQFSIVGTPLPSTLATGSTASLTLRYAPNVRGQHSATLRITSNDPNFQPYLVQLRGLATAPEIVVEAPASLADGSNVAVGTAVMGDPALTRSFTIRNIGTEALGDLVLIKEGSEAADFTVSPLSRNTLAVGESQSFTVSFAPSAVGPRSATLHIRSNDADESPFDIVLIGRGTALELAFAAGGRVSRPSQDIALGTLDTGSVVERSFTLRNAGEQALTGLRLEITGMEAGQFTVMPPLPSRLEVGASVSLTLRFTARVDGAIDTAVRLLCDQRNEEPALLRLTATVRAAKLVVRDALTGQVREAANFGKAVIAWGNNGSGQTVVPAGLSGVVAIAAGGDHTVALKQDGSVVAWGDNGYGQTNVPAGLSGVVAIAAGGAHTVALKQDGSAVAWGYNNSGQTNVPAGLSGVVAIAAGGAHTVALKQDGSVVAWGWNDYGQTNVPAGLSGVVTIAAGWAHTVALKQNGRVVALGANHKGQTSVPVGLRGVMAIAAGGFHTVALKQDGSVVAWGYNDSGQTNVPAALSGVVAIAAGHAHTVALKQDGSIVAWGDNYSGQTSLPVGLSGAEAIAAGGANTVVIADPLPLAFTRTQLGQASSTDINLFNTGTLPLTLSSITITGPDADLFRIISPVPTGVAVGWDTGLTVQFQPTRTGRMRAQLHIASNDPATPDYVLNLHSQTDITAAKAGTAGAVFTYAPLRVDRDTGLLVQRVNFTNNTGTSLPGLRLVLSNVAKGVTVYSSSVGDEAGTLEVIYSRAIAAGEAISFDLVYFDPLRRTADKFNPTIRAHALSEPEPDSLPVPGTLVKLRAVKVSTQGPWLYWSSLPRAQYVVEYSDDGGSTWFSAVHRLSTVGTTMMWTDRGQPETRSKPTGQPNKPGGRYYRVKKL